MAPSPSPAPKVPPPIVTAAPTAGANAPTVLIYPFQTPSDLDAKYGTAIAQIYAQVLTDTGGLKVLTIPSGIKQEDYEKYASVQHADYYISGIIQPIGTGASVVSSIYYVTDDIGVTSQTTQVENVNDIGSQALTARTIILQHAGIDRPDLQIAQATPEPTSSSGASVSVNNVLGDLFRQRSKQPKGARTPEPTPTPVPPKPARSVIVTKVTGRSSPTDLTNATNMLTQALYKYYNTSMNETAVNDIARQADGICGAKRDNTIANGVLVTTHVGGMHPHDTYAFTLNIVTCFGAILYSQTENGDNHDKVIKDAVEAYFTDHPNNS